MPIIYQKFIFRSDLQANPDVYYVFGDNDCREGKGGQAKEMRGEPNAIGIRTKKAPTYEKHDFYFDWDYDANIAKISEDFERVRLLLGQGKTVIYPQDGVGTGRANLLLTAPKTLQFIQVVESELFEQYSVKEGEPHD